MTARLALVAFATCLALSVAPCHAQEAADSQGPGLGAADASRALPRPTSPAPPESAGPSGSPELPKTATLPDAVPLPESGSAGALETTPTETDPRGTQAPMTNADVVAMATNGFSDATIIAAMHANRTRFDVTPSALLALKTGGVSEAVIGAMLEAVRGREAATGPETVEAAMGPATSEAVTSAPASGERRGAAPPPMSGTEPTIASAATAPTAAPTASTAVAAVFDASTGRREPRVWIVDGALRVPLEGVAAEVAYTDEKGADKRLGSTAVKTLRVFADKTLSFASPALGIASSLGGLLRPGDPTLTAIWALPGASSARTLGSGVLFEIDFGGIPGVNPDDFVPAIVQLVPTPDNYRLVGAAKTKASERDRMPTDGVIEERVRADLTALGRGRYRVKAAEPLARGEYALVLRPVERKERDRHRKADAPLGTLLGAGSAEILYRTWDFSIADSRSSAADSPPD